MDTSIVPQIQNAIVIVPQDELLERIAELETQLGIAHGTIAALRAKLAAAEQCAQSAGGALATARAFRAAF